MSTPEILLIVTVVPLGLTLLGFWIWMLIDCLKHEAIEGHDRLVWTLVIVLLKFFGAGIYYFLRYRPRHLATG